MGEWRGQTRAESQASATSAPHLHREGNSLEKRELKLGVGVHSCNPSTPEVRAGGSRGQSQH